MDFHIAYYIGRLAATVPDARFQVISKDAGFDPLLEHLKQQGISCQRSISIIDVPLAKISKSESLAERVNAVVANLAKRKSAKPRTPKALRATIKTLFASQLSEDELDRLIEKLTTRGLMKIVDGKVQYDLPT